MTSLSLSLWLSGAETKVIAYDSDEWEARFGETCRKLAESAHEKSE